MKRAIALADHFETAGVRAAVYSVHTLKPLDTLGIGNILLGYPHVVVVEECAPNGSLAMRVKELAWTFGAKCRLDTFTLQDAFIHCYGSHDDILDAHGLSTKEIYARLAQTCTRCATA
jgi:transketolase